MTKIPLHLFQTKYLLISPIRRREGGMVHVYLSSLQLQCFFYLTMLQRAARREAV